MLTPRQLLGWWRIALVIIAVVAAVITPSADPISMMALAVPMALLYFVSIGIGAVVLKLRQTQGSQGGTPAGADGVRVRGAP